MQGNLSITHFEMLNIVVVLHLWGEMWQGKHINLLVDNAAVVTICNTGFTRDVNLAIYARNIWLLTAIYDIELKVTHIPGYVNKQADLLSRWDPNSQQHREKLKEWVPNAQWHNVPDAYFNVNMEI